MTRLPSVGKMLVQQNKEMLKNGQADSSTTKRGQITNWTFHRQQEHLNSFYSY